MKDCPEHAGLCCAELIFGVTRVGRPAPQIAFAHRSGLFHRFVFLAATVSGGDAGCEGLQPQDTHCLLRFIEYDFFLTLKTKSVVYNMCVCPMFVLAGGQLAAPVCSLSVGAPSILVPRRESIGFTLGNIG